MAASKTTAPAEQYDFDNWSPEKEQAALQALVPEVKYIIVEGSYVGRFPDGTIIKLPLSISLDDVDALGEGAEVDQLKALLTSIGGEEAAKTFTSQDLIASTAMAEQYFGLFEKVSKASRPE